MTQFVAIAPAQSNQKVAFQKFYQGRYAAIGWLPDDDLTGKTLSEVYAIIECQIGEEAVFDDKGKPVFEDGKPKIISAEKNQAKVKRNFTSFLSLKPGMLVVVPNVNYGLHGIGRIVSGYQYQKGKHDLGKESYNHFCEVEWYTLSSEMLTSDALLFKDANKKPLEKSWPPRGFACSSVQEADWLTRLLDKLENSTPTTVTVVMVDDDNHVVEEQVEVVEKPYTGDSFSQDEEGRFIGDDEFVVPKDFNEFYTLWPDYTRRWVMKRTHKVVVDPDVEDWEADLLMHLRYLPEKSKFRKPGVHRWHPEGCEDVIQVFDPILQYGASARRFFNYMKNCLSNRYSTINSKRLKNPICALGNYALGSPMDETYSEVVDDEYIHRHCIVTQSQTSQDTKIFLEEYKDFVASVDESLVPVLDALATTASYREASEDLHMNEAEFTRCRNRLRVLKDCFLKGQAVPKQRKPYKKRELQNLNNFSTLSSTSPNAIVIA